MKRMLCLLAALGLLAGCAQGISQEEYDRLVSDRDRLQAQIDEIATQLERLEKGQDSAEKASEPDFSGGNREPGTPGGGMTDRPISKEGFFDAAERRDAFRDCVLRYDFAALQSLIQDYIAGGGTDEADIVHSVIQALGNGPALLESCVVVVDDITGKQTINYRGVEELSGRINLVPYIEDGERKCRVGFRQREQIRFDKYTIQAGVDYYLPVYLEDTQTVVDRDGDGVLEYTECIIGYEDAVNIYEFDKAMIRFENVDQTRIREHLLTPEEKEALLTLCTLDRRRQVLVELLEEWERAYA